MNKKIIHTFSFLCLCSVLVFPKSVTTVEDGPIKIIKTDTFSEVLKHLRRDGVLGFDLDYCSVMPDEKRGELFREVYWGPLVQNRQKLSGINKEEARMYIIKTVASLLCYARFIAVDQSTTRIVRSAQKSWGLRAVGGITARSNLPSMMCNTIKQLLDVGINFEDTPLCQPSNQTEAELLYDPTTKTIVGSFYRGVVFAEPGVDKGKTLKAIVIPQLEAGNPPPRIIFIDDSLTNIQKMVLAVKEMNAQYLSYATPMEFVGIHFESINPEAAQQKNLGLLKKETCEVLKEMTQQLLDSTSDMPLNYEISFKAMLRYIDHLLKIEVQNWQSADWQFYVKEILRLLEIIKAFETRGPLGDVDFEALLSLRGGTPLPIKREIPIGTFFSLDRQY